MKNLIYLAIFIFAGLKFGFLENPFASEPQFADIPSDTVILYSTSWCGYCRKARKLMRTHGIEFVELDIEKSEVAKEQYQKLNGRGVPLIYKNGKVLRGFDPEKIKRL